MTANNPLLQISSLPNFAPTFNIYKTEHYLPAIEAAINEARTNIDTIKNNPDAPTFDNTILAMESASETLGTITSIFYNQLSALGGDDMQELAEKIGPITSSFSSDIILDETLFHRIQTIYDDIDSLNLSTEQHALLSENYKDFVRGGALLPEEQKQRLREINQALSTLSPAFANNVNKSSEQFEMLITDQSDLSGLPDSVLDGALQAAAEKNLPEGTYRFTLDYPSFGPFLQFSDNRDLREKIWRAFSSRSWSKDGTGEYDNNDNILKTIKLKHERANILGYKTHAQYVLERRMAKTPETVFAFLNTLKAAYKPAAQKDFDALSAFAKEEHGLDALKPWDVGYYSEKLKQKRFAFSSEDFRPYFPLDQVLSGCFEHFSKLFGLIFTENKKYTPWHEDVKTFDVHDKDTGKFISTFYADFHPRIGKKPGAWMTSYRDQGLFRGKIERPIIAIVCNFTKPTADKPSLLTHGEVTTLFHEMGHAVHGMLSDVTYRSCAGTNVKWDFVELPSQVQENWCMEKETLDMFARHYKTGEKIPSELIEKLKKSHNFMVGWAGLRQVNLATIDMAWHTTDPETINDVAAFEDEHSQDSAFFPRMAGPVSTSFSHIFAGGYSAGYYSYKWAEVLDADTFELFKEKGLYDQDTAKSYQSNILSKGSSEDPDILYHKFRGRDADPDALLRREDLIQETA